MLLEVLRFLLGVLESTEPAKASRARSARTTLSCCGLELDALLPAPAAGAANSDDLVAKPEDEELEPIVDTVALELELLEDVPASAVGGAVVVFSNSDL